MLNNASDILDYSVQDYGKHIYSTDTDSKFRIFRYKNISYILT